MIVLGDLTNVTEAVSSAERLRSCLVTPFEVNGNEFFVTGSVGIAFADGNAEAEVLISDADTAMYQARNRDGTP